MMDYNDLNRRIINREDCFYWQTDRKISAEETKEIWKDRHSAITNDELFEIINSSFLEDKLEFLEPFDANAQTSLGNINSIRVGKLKSGRKVVIRCHPKNVKNGYFYVESLAADLALKNGIPTYGTYLIHDINKNDSIAFQMIEMLDGDTITFHLKQNPENEEKMVMEMGRMMAKLHDIRVDGFGPFNNEAAKKGELIGIHKTLKDAVMAGLDENLERLVDYKIIDKKIAEKIKNLFLDSNLLDYKEPRLLHNDFADWNLLTDGEKIVGVLDWDECVGGDPVEEIACWSTFFAPERLGVFLKGYFEENERAENFEEKLNLFRLRYVISKMALRVKRYTYDQSDFVKQLIENGMKHLEELIKIFKLEEDDENYKI